MWSSVFRFHQQKKPAALPGPKDLTSIWGEGGGRMNPVLSFQILKYSKIEIWYH